MAWLDATDGKRMIFGYDQGGTITLDGGLAWSSWYNQPTAQIYHIGVDNSWPYWIYGSEQDSCAVSVRSRGEFGAVTMLDWSPTPAYENGFVAPDPLDPNVAAGSVLEWDEDGGQIVVRRAGQFTSEDIHRTLFPEGPPKPRTLDELKDGIRQHVRKKHARR